VQDHGLCVTQSLFVQKTSATIENHSIYMILRISLLRVNPMIYMRDLFLIVDSKSKHI